MLNAHWFKINMAVHAAIHLSLILTRLNGTPAHIGQLKKALHAFMCINTPVWMRPKVKSHLIHLSSEYTQTHAPLLKCSFHFPPDNLGAGYYSPSLLFVQNRNYKPHSKTKLFLFVFNDCKKRLHIIMSLPKTNLDAFHHCWLAVVKRVKVSFV